MRRGRLDRLIGLLIVSWGLGWLVAHDLFRKHRMGEEGYLSYQRHHYEKFIVPFQHPIAHAFGYAIFFMAGLAIYESIVLAIQRLHVLLSPNTNV